jgi:hypothetical protein
LKKLSLGQVPHGFLKRHDPYGFLKRHDPTLGPLAQSAVVFPGNLKLSGGLGQVPHGVLKRHDPTLGPLAQSAVVFPGNLKLSGGLGQVSHGGFKEARPLRVFKEARPDFGPFGT